jgi:hypothetical protein
MKDRFSKFYGLDLWSGLAIGWKFSLLTAHAKKNLVVSISNLAMVTSL